MIWVPSEPVIEPAKHGQVRARISQTLCTPREDARSVTKLALRTIGKVGQFCLAEKQLLLAPLDFNMSVSENSV